MNAAAWCVIGLYGLGTVMSLSEARRYRRLRGRLEAAATAPVPSMLVCQECGAVHLVEFYPDGSALPYARDG